MWKSIFLSACLLCLMVLANPVSAALIDRGTGMIYDTELGITWMQDVNYAQTSGYDADGRMSWDQANTWAANLVYGGYNDWRLPKTLPVNGLNYVYANENDSIFYNGSADKGYNISASGSIYAGSSESEMAFMYYNNLRNPAAYDLNGVWQNTGIERDSSLLNTGPFINLRTDYYWSANECPFNQEAGFGFNFANGGQGDPIKYFNGWAWAVRDGDSGPSVSAGSDYVTGLVLGDTFSFDYLWLMGQEPDSFNMDIFYFRDNSWHLLGGDINIDGSSSSWETISYAVPDELQGIETQIRFGVLDLFADTDPTVYLRNIASSGNAPVPEPATILLLGTGLLGLAGFRKMRG